jgi:DNA-binding IclR family transcriptional regulator
MPRRTPYTITSLEVLRTELDQIRVRGWAENVNESEMGVASISAPIRDRAGAVVAAVSVAGPVQRVNGDNLRRFARPVTDAAAQISHRLAGGFAEPRGGRGGPGGEPMEAS